jgi:hypothetical protein
MPLTVVGIDGLPIVSTPAATELPLDSVSVFGSLDGHGMTYAHLLRL